MLIWIDFLGNFFFPFLFCYDLISKGTALLLLSVLIWLKFLIRNSSNSTLFDFCKCFNIFIRHLWNLIEVSANADSPLWQRAREMLAAIFALHPIYQPEKQYVSNQKKKDIRKEKQYINNQKKDSPQNFGDEPGNLIKNWM